MCYYGSVFLLNISNIRCVTTKPPAIFTDDNTTAIEANACGNECGKYPPPKINNPPTAVIPEIAFVIDIKGVWREGVTPQTEKYPVITERENILVMVNIAGSAHVYPSPKNPNNPADKVAAFLNVFWKKLVSTGLITLCYILWPDFDASNIGGCGLGQSTCLFWVMIAPLTT